MSKQTPPIRTSQTAAIEQVVVGGDIMPDFDADGRLLGVEIIGASQLLHPASLSAAERLWGIV